MLFSAAPWPAFELARLQRRLCSLFAVSLLCTSTPALRYTRHRGLFAAVLVSAIAGLASLVLGRIGAENRVNSLTALSVALYSLNAASLCAFVASVGLSAGSLPHSSQASLQVYAWALLLSSVPMLACGGLLLVREEVAEAEARLAKTADRGGGRRPPWAGEGVRAPSRMAAIVGQAVERSTDDDLELG